MRNSVREITQVSGILERGRCQVPDRYMHVRCHMCIYGEAVPVRKSVCLSMSVIHPYL